MDIKIIHVKNLLIALISLVSTSEVYAAPLNILLNTNNFYLSAESGISIPSFYGGELLGAYYGDAKPKVGMQLGVEAGYQFSNALKIGLRASYRAHNIDQITKLDGQNMHGENVKEEAHVDQQFSSILFMINSQYSMNDFYGVTPYIIAGIGMNDASNSIRTEYSVASTDIIILTKYHGIDKITFAWYIGAGIAKDLEKNIKLNLGYRFTDLGKRSTSNGNYVYNKQIDEFLHANIDSTFFSASLKAHEITLGLIYCF